MPLSAKQPIITVSETALRRKGTRKTMDEKFPLALPEGTILAGQYMIEKVLGQGGFGITYRAVDHKTGQKVAVKEFFPDTLAYREATTVISYPGERTENYEYGKESFLQEAQTLAEFIGNENIVRIHSYFEENGTAYFVMDYIEGTSFDAYLKEKGGRISMKEAENILIPVMDALNVVHSKGIVHRDVTPDNIYLTNDGKVKLLDFGAARYSLGDKSRSLDVILKHGFAPKEQYTRRGKQGPFTDVYSLGATFYFALTGKRPPDSVERLDEDDLIPPSNLGVEITEYQERAILQALSVQPAERFQSMADFKQVLLQENTAANQIFFTAPPAAAPAMQQTAATMPYQTTQQGYPTVVQTAQAGPSAKEKVAPLLEKIRQMKHKKLIAGVAGGLLLAVIAVRILSGIGAGGETERASGKSAHGEDSYAEADYHGTEEPDYGTEEPVYGTEEPDYGTEESQGQSDFDASGLQIVGTTAGNIKNFGTYTANDGSEFWLDDGQHSLVWNEGYIYRNQTGTFNSLAYDRGILYFGYDGKAYMRDLMQGTAESLIAELSGHNNITRLFVTDKYYFIYDSDYILTRVSRQTGQEEESSGIDSGYFTFDNDGHLYTVGVNEDGHSTIYQYRADDFSAPVDYIWYKDGTRRFEDIVVDGDWLYVFMTDGTSTYLQRLSTDFSDESYARVWDITAYVTENGTDGDNEAICLNVKDGFVAFNVYDSDSDDFMVLYITEDPDQGFQQHQSDPDYGNCLGYVCFPCSGKASENYCWFRYNPDTDLWMW